MAIKVITDFGHLFRLAHALGKARISGDQQRIAIAEREHDEYHKLCLQSDEMTCNSIKNQL